MYGSWTEIAVLLRIFLGFIWDPYIIRCFNGVYLFSKSANSIFKILIDFPFWRDDFENFNSKLIRWLGTYVSY